MIYISHNLGLILETCDRICVMYSGQAVELGSVKQVFDADAPSLYARAVLLDPAARHRQDTRVRWCRSAASCRCRATGPPGCTFGPRCDFFVAGRCDKPIPMLDSQGRSRPRGALRPLSTRSTGTTHRPKGVETRAARARRSRCCKCDDMKKYYEIRDNSIGALFSRQAGALREGQREARLRGPRGRDRGHRRRVRLRQVDLRQGADGARRARPTARSCSTASSRHICRCRSGQPGTDLEPADGLPEPVRHAQPQPFGRRADRPRAARNSASPRRAREIERAGPTSCSTW